jgi:hypothetical protein
VSNPEITKDSLIKALKDALPGAKVHVSDRIGGVVLKVHVWQWTLEASVNTSVITDGDKIGFAILRLHQTLDKGSEKTVDVLGLNTDSLIKVQVFMGRVRAFLQGVAVAILSTCDAPAPEEPMEDFGEW